jgi:uracil-DNA glycosylase
VKVAVGNGALAQLHEEIQRCDDCREQLDPGKALRVCSSVPTATPLFLVAQALAQDTQRVTGVAYFDKRGRLGSTGRALERFLNAIGATLYPPQPVCFQEATISAAVKSLVPVYASEIVQCFPGRRNGDRGGSDRFSGGFARQCLQNGFLEREIELVDPEVILLLGRQSYHWFWRHFAGRAPPENGIRVALQAVVDRGRADTITVAGRARHVVPLVHAWGQTMALFRRLVMQNRPLHELLNGLLQGSR